MLNLFRAEWIKVVGNRWVAGCMIWIFPIGALGFVVVLAVILALSSAARASFIQSPMQWTDQAISVWNFPKDPIGRIILMGFTAVVFAGEYQWGTWKNTIPRSHRVCLILMKFFTVGVFIIIAFLLMSVILAVGTGLLVAIAGGTYGPRVTGDVLRDFIGDYALQASTTFISIMIAAGYAALAAMITRSILGGIVTGFVITLAEGLSILGLLIAAALFDVPRLVLLYRFTPTYNLLNVISWLSENTPGRIEVPVNGETVAHSDSLSFSVVVLASWMIALVGLTVFWFKRQDITS